MKVLVRQDPDPAVPSVGAECRPGVLAPVPHDSFLLLVQEAVVGDMVLCVCIFVPLFPRTLGMQGMTWRWCKSRLDGWLERMSLCLSTSPSESLAQRW